MTNPPPYDHQRWLRYVFSSARLAMMMIAVALSIGILGYHFLGHLGWIDALLEASMILGGMGPIAPLQNNTIKIFASVYAMASGLLLIGTTGVLLGPWLHRLVHHPKHVRDAHK